MRDSLKKQNRTVNWSEDGNARVVNRVPSGIQLKGLRCQVKLMLFLSPDSPAFSSKRNKAALSAARVFRRMITTMP
ncbi:MAG TPA: hypothetical protein VK210_11575 [Terriglobia bacterium]|nr:hypothetical protein [Terriglobia bacterium]